MCSLSPAISPCLASMARGMRWLDVDAGSPKPTILPLTSSSVLTGAIGARDDDAVVGRRSLLDADRERFDVRGFGLRQHVRERPEIGDLNSCESHGFDHRRVIRRHHELDVLLQFCFKIFLQWFGVLNDRRRVLVRQQGDPELGRIILRQREPADRDERRSAGEREEEVTAIHGDSPLLVAVLKSVEGAESSAKSAP